jgi:glycosyltransferase involved in cell wall biosynthesis
MLFTILTPTYNRGYLLKNLYDSLCTQSCKDFEWIIVDDGSSDNTKDVVEDFIKEKLIDIRYFQKVNGGKHTAVNLGVGAAKGEIVLILDSDDCLPATSLSTISKYYLKIRNDSSIGGVCGYMAHRNGELIGTMIKKYPITTDSLAMRYSLGIKGDMCEVFRTEVLRKYPFPEIHGEKFCPEVLVWNRIAEKYKLLLFKEVIYQRDYLNNGLTANIVKIRMNSPISASLTYSEMLSRHIPWWEKCKAAINYYRFSLCTNRVNRPEISSFWAIFKPLGWLMHKFDIGTTK